MDRIVDIDSRAIAQQLVEARRLASALPQYPGTIPASLDAGYACQDAAIPMWPSSIAGWKVGKIPDTWVDRLGEDRLVGPIFENRVQRPHDHRGTFPVITDGFAAIEAEFIFVLGADAAAGKTDWTFDEAAALVDSLRVGVELAGSALPDINRLGPPVVVSDYGNNAGLILGPAIADWQQRSMDELPCETFIDGMSVGSGRASSIPGGPLAALVFALSRCARRGLPLRAGQYVSTGAATGIHDIVAGQQSRVEFPGLASFQITAIVAQPQEWP
ncbi:2-keto-4-pentenoate hydratase [Thermomonas carbonis]|uniref:2-keto-4-pentenoate hydratase n=1 Tax=Thermomonas carbonis TaxID=1463158 RepID=A0A7G9STF8_9GAMM|nr:2-keto-4-pentenoate hydratase [Thermomonas carbonis]GHC11765.1 2-keto-4-pentenoate hydratase [Thermomonas carbonis]